jgi:hypothetical protein
MFKAVLTERMFSYSFQWQQNHPLLHRKEQAAKKRSSRIQLFFYSSSKLTQSETVKDFSKTSSAVGFRSDIILSRV